MRSFLFSIGMICLNAVTAQTILHSVSEAHQLAEKNNIGIKSSRIQEEIARFDKRSAIAAYLPALQIQAQSDYNVELPVQLIPNEIFGGPAGGFQEVQFGRPWNSSAGIDFTQPILHADKVAQVNASKHTEAQVKLEQQANRISLLQSVTQAYFAVLMMEENLKLNLALDSTAKALYLNVKARYDKELVSKIDINRTENLWIQTHQQTLRLESERNAALRQLAVLLNMGGDNALQIQDRLEHYSNSTEISPIRPEQRFSYLASKEAEEAAKWRWKQQSWQRYPKLSFNSRYNFASQGDRWLGTGSNQFQFGTVGLSLSVPIFKGGNQLWQSKKASLGYEISKLQSEQARLNGFAELSDWMMREKEKSTSAELASKRDSLSAESLRLSLLSYEQGLIPLSEVFNAYNEYTQARISWVQAVGDAATYRLLLKLENNTGN